MASTSTDTASEQLLELLLTLKKTTPASARAILNSQPAIAYALISLMVQMNAINVEVFQKVLSESTSSSNILPPSAPQHPSLSQSSVSIAPTSITPLPAPAAQAPIPAIPPHLQTQYRTTTPPGIPTHTPTPPGGYAAVQNPSVTPTGGGAYSSMYASPSAQATQGYGYSNQHQHQQGGYPPAPGPSGYHGGYQQYQQQQQGGYWQQQQQQHQPTPPAGGQTAAGGTPVLPESLAGIPDEQKALILRVLSMTPEQINMLPPQDRATYIQIRTTLGVPTM